MYKNLNLNKFYIDKKMFQYAKMFFGLID